MDIVLELCDTFFLDQLYARLLPKCSANPLFNPVSTISVSSSGYAGNATRYDAENYAAPSAWQYQPSTTYFTLQPSEYAWMSRWDRDHMVRQFLSLYVVTKYVHRPSTSSSPVPC